MPFVYATYLNHIHGANAHFERFKNSSLHALDHLLAGAGPGGANAAQRKQILAALGLVPFAKQQKYAAGLNYAVANLHLNIHGIPYGYPVNLRTRLDFYEVASAAWSPVQTDWRADGWFEHNFIVEWDSSNGNMASLAHIWNRESVTFLQNPAGLPFNHLMANTPMAYTYGVSHSSHASGSDNHYFMHPSLMLTYPLAPGIVTANQAYQYSPDQGVTWYRISNGQFTFSKGVRVSHGQLVFVFSKQNRAPVNPRTYHFEVEYAIGPAPANPPANYNAVRGRGTGQQVPLNTYATVIAPG